MDTAARRPGPYFTVPSINDITAAELRALLPRLAALDPVLAEAMAAGTLRVCSSGGAAGGRRQHSIIIFIQC